MSHQDAPGILKAELRWAQGQATAMNELHFMNDTTGPWSEADMDTISDLILTDFWSGYLASITGLDVYQAGLILTDLTSIQGLRKKYPAPSYPAHGSALTRGLSPNVAFCVKMQTQLRGKGRSGRFYHFGVPYGFATQSKVTVTYANNVAAALRSLASLIVFNLPLCQMCVLSRRLNREPRPVAVGLGIEGFYWTDLNLDSQRNRLFGHRKASVGY